MPFEVSNSLLHLITSLKGAHKNMLVKQQNFNKKNLSVKIVSLAQWFLNFFVCFNLLTKMIIRFTPNI